MGGHFHRGGGGEMELNGHLNDNSCSSRINEGVLRSCVCPDEWGMSIETLGGYIPGLATMVVSFFVLGVFLGEAWPWLLATGGVQRSIPVPVDR